MPVEIREATEADEDAVFQYLLEHFYPDEPLNSSLGRIPDCKQNCPPVAFLSQRLSFIAVDKDNPDFICGMALNHGIILDGADDKWVNVTDRDPKTPYGKAIKFFKHIDAKFYEAIGQSWPQAWNKKSFDLCMLSVRSNHRRDGLAKQLFEKTMTKARESDYKFMRIDCSSAFSANLAQKMGFKLVYQLPYDQYKDEAGVAVLKVAPPHINYACFLKEIT